MTTKPTFSPWRPHPWHGLNAGKNPPEFVTAYIEITALDGIKYEIDKDSGYLKVDRPQLSSSLPPALYGFIPQTYCGDAVGKLAGAKVRGDGDPLDICVLSERIITRSDILVPTRVIGGFKMIDRGEADDKIIAVLEMDPYWDNVKDLSDLSPVLQQRLQHYFLTYKLQPGQTPVVKIDQTYGLATAKQVIETSMKDYQDYFNPEF